MLKSIFLAVLAGATLALPAPADAGNGLHETAPVSWAARVKSVAKTGYALMSGLALAYEIYGAADQLFLANDGFDAASLLGDVLGELAENRLTQGGRGSGFAIPLPFLSGQTSWVL